MAVGRRLKRGYMKNIADSLHLLFCVDLEESENRLKIPQISAFWDLGEDCSHLQKYIYKSGRQCWPICSY